jgi:hypothetical protein
MLVYFINILSILRPFGIFYVRLNILWYFGMLYQEKSGNPGSEKLRGRSEEINGIE